MRRHNGRCKRRSRQGRRIKRGFPKGRGPERKRRQKHFSGVFGDAEPILYDKRPLIELGNRNMVKQGKGYIYTTLEGGVPCRYEIEIVKVIKQNSPSDKSMVIHITDKALLNRAGGICQGMSGSPIIQNGKLIGAVTHVFINDPTRGYGIYIDWMIDN